MERIKLLVSDGDGTAWYYLCNKFGSSWGALASILRVKTEADKLLEDYYAKPDLIDEWARKHVALFEGKSIESAQDGLYPIPYTKGFRDFVGSVRGVVRLGLLTSGLDIVAKRAAEELELDFCYCNVLCRENGCFSGKFENRVPMWEKEEVLREICVRERVSLQEVGYVGDSKNDVRCVQISGVGVAFNPKDEEIRYAADFVIDDFRKLHDILRI